MIEGDKPRPSEDRRPGEDNTSLAEKFREAEAEGLCPQCGRKMEEIDRLTTDDHTLIWMKCSREGCDGRWLQQREAGETAKRNSA